MIKLTKDELFKLINAGYTKDDITGMFEPEEDQTADDPMPEEPAAADSNETHEKDIIPSETAIITDSYIKQLQDAVKELTAAVHKQNINNDDSAGKQTVRTDEDIIANVIYGGKAK